MSKIFELFLDGSWQTMPKGKDLYNKAKTAGLPIRVTWASGKSHVVANHQNAPEADKPKADKPETNNVEVEVEVPAEMVLDAEGYVTHIGGNSVV